MTHSNKIVCIYSLCMASYIYIYIYICIKVISGLIGLIYENIAKIEKKISTTLFEAEGHFHHFDL